MPHINVQNSDTDTNSFEITRDYHIESIDFVSNHFPVITWKNQLHFKTHSLSRSDTQNTVHRIKELIHYYQLHRTWSIFPRYAMDFRQLNFCINDVAGITSHGFEHRLILKRGTNILWTWWLKLSRRFSERD